MGTKTDKIMIKNLEVFGYHGVFSEETDKGQKFIISATLYCDLRKAGQTDDLLKTINYGGTTRMMHRFVEKHRFQLIETVAERLAEKMLLEVPRLQKIKIEVQKPEAPIGLPLETVAVEIEREWHIAYLGLGSNMGDKEAFLEAGIESLADTKGCVVEKVSDFITTRPYGGVVQDDFLNGALRLKTLLTPEELLRRIKQIEEESGRERTVRWGPRTLDLDILLYDDIIMDDAKLHIPHLEMHNRDFVLKPLFQIAPYLRHPLFGDTVAEMLENVDEIYLVEECEE